MESAGRIMEILEAFDPGSHVGDHAGLCLDECLRRIGVTTYALTDNEKTVTSEHVAGVPVRHPDMAAPGRHYGVTIATCVPADPQTKDGSEATVRIAKADVVPTAANLRGNYAQLRRVAGGLRWRRTTGGVQSDDATRRGWRRSSNPAHGCQGDI